MSTPGSPDAPSPDGPDPDGPVRDDTDPDKADPDSPDPGRRAAPPTEVGIPAAAAPHPGPAGPQVDPGSVPRYPGQRYPAAPGHAGAAEPPSPDETWTGIPYPAAPWTAQPAQAARPTQPTGPPWPEQAWPAPQGAGQTWPPPQSPGPWGAPEAGGRYQGHAPPGPFPPGPYPAGAFPPGSFPPGPFPPGTFPPGHGGSWDAPAGLTAPPPRRRGRTAAFVTVAVLVVLALVAGAGALLGGRLGRSGPEIPASFQPVRTDFMTYSVPPNWTLTPTGGPSVLGVSFGGRADAPPYTCRGDSYVRGSASSALISDRSDPARLAAQFAAQIATQSYTGTAGQEPAVTIVSTTPVQVPGPGATETTGSLVEVRATPPSDDGCLGTEGVVLVLAVPATVGGRTGTALLTSGVDTAGGPADPPVPPRQDMDLIVSSAALPG
ncbi:MAG: hypothetical protein OJJ54_14535 [Pseudonocardia sp.]|nr:hypothetical protein [Pseudonocardia sp.]